MLLVKGGEQREGGELEVAIERKKRANIQSPLSSRSLALHLILNSGPSNEFIYMPYVPRRCMIYRVLLYKGLN